MDRSDIIEKLQLIASEGGTIAELNACKALLALPEFADEGSVDADPFAALEGDELAKRRAA